MSAEVHGMDNLLKSLSKFSDKIQKSVLTGAIRAGASSIAKEAKSKVPKEKGDLRKSIKAVKRRSKEKGVVHFSVVPHTKTLHKLQLSAGRKKGYNFASHLEFGSSKHSATPFMRPAFENKGAESIEVVKKYIKKRIDKEIKKART